MARCPTCFSIIGQWTDDPILTPKGLSGINYIGFTPIKPIHITELQQDRQNKEINVGIEESDRTVFTSINARGDIYKKHIRELRTSTEKILVKTGQTKEEYFNYDSEGNEYNIGNHQTDWTDSNLTGIKNLKARHIEELRHYLRTIPAYAGAHIEISIDNGIVRTIGAGQDTFYYLKKNEKIENSPNFSLEYHDFGRDWYDNGTKFGVCYEAKCEYNYSIAQSSTNVDNSNVLAKISGLRYLADSWKIRDDTLGTVSDYWNVYNYPICHLKIQDAKASQNCIITVSNIYLENITYYYGGAPINYIDIAPFINIIDIGDSYATIAINGYWTTGIKVSGWGWDEEAQPVSTISLRRITS